MTYSRRLWHPEDERQLNGRRQTLEKGDGPPRPLVVSLRRAPCNPSNEDGSHVPQTVVDSSKLSAVLGVTNLGEEDRRAHLGETVAETQNKTTSHIDLPVGSEGRDESTSDHYGTANGDGNFSTPPFGGEGSIEAGQ